LLKYGMICGTLFEYLLTWATLDGVPPSLSSYSKYLML
jgi:hypothetical protein